MLRLTSENEVWEMGTYLILSDVRVSCGGIGSLHYIKGRYCCGQSPELLVKVVAYLRDILNGLPEEVSEADVTRLLPSWTRRTSARDSDCLEALRQLAYDAIQPSETDERLHELMC